MTRLRRFRAARCSLERAFLRAVLSGRGVADFVDGTSILTPSPATAAFRKALRSNLMSSVILSSLSRCLFVQSPDWVSQGDRWRQVLGQDYGLFSSLETCSFAGVVILPNQPISALD